MKLKKLISALQVKKSAGDDNILISGIESDSRNIKPNFLFVAVKGNTVDGHDYIEKAIEKGASAILCEYIPENTNHLACTLDRKSVV